MDDEQISRWGKALLIKISVITGWVLPTEQMLNILVDQFKKKMTESYSACNAEEVEYAFRNFGSYVKDWGKQINLNMIDEVMQPYLQRRYQQSKVEESAAPPVLQIAYKEDMSDDAMDEWLKREIEYIKTGKPFEFVPVELYEYLVKKGRIAATNEEKRQYLERAVAWRGAQLLKEVETRNTADNRMALEKFKVMRERGYFTGDEIERLKALAKKLLFFDHVLKTE